MKMLATLSCLCVFAAASVSATVVSWNLDPNATEDTEDAANHTFLQPSSPVTANADAVAWQSHTPLRPYHVFGQTDLGSVGPAGQPRRVKGYFPTQSVQFEINSIFPQGDTDEKLQLGSVESPSNGEFAISVPSTLGDAGVQTEGMNDRASDMVFASIANLTNGQFSSFGSLSSGALTPVAFQATLTPVPEIGALFPILGLIAAVAVTQILRRRRIAQLRAASSDAN